MIIYMDTEAFGGIGCDADGIINRNVGIVSENLKGVCDGLVVMGTTAYGVGVKSNASTYSVQSLDKEVAVAVCTNQQYFGEANKQYMVYDAADKPYILCEEANKLSSAQALKPDTDVAALLDSDQKNILNQKIKMCKDLGIKDMKQLNQLLSTGADLSSLSNYEFNQVIGMINLFMYLGYYKDFNQEYVDYNGSIIENDWFCRTGMIVEFYPDFLLKELQNITGVSARSSYSRRSIAKYSNYSDKFVMLTLFVKFRTLWLSVSIDIKYLIQQIISIMRSPSSGEFVFSKESFMEALKSLRTYISKLLLILRTFSIGFDFYNTLIKASADFSNCSLSASIYKNCYRRLY